LNQRRKPPFGKNKRRRHRHRQVTVFYRDGEKVCSRVYGLHEVRQSVERQKKSPVVKASRVKQVGTPRLDS